MPRTPGPFRGTVLVTLLGALLLAGCSATADGSTAATARPATSAPGTTLPKGTESLVGRYASAYYGDARIELNAAGDALQLVLGPAAVRHGLRHWDGDVFTFAPQGESATPGSISALTFTPGQMQIERYAEDLERGRFQRVADRP